MPSGYPSSLDSFSNPTSSNKLNDSGVVHADQHANANDAIEAIQATLGINPQGASATVVARLGTLATLASPTFTGTPAAPTAAANTNTTQIATTAFVLGQGNTTAATIAALGSQAAGASNLYARADHVHPTTGLALLSGATFTGAVTLPVGTASLAPLIFQSGVLLTTVAGGRMEYDGRLHYLTPSSTAVGGRAVAESTHYYSLSSNRTLSDVATVQSIFGVGLTVQATTTYEIEMLVSVSSTGVNSNSLGIGFGGTATLTSIGYQVEVAQNATSAATLTSGSQAFIAVATNTTITPAVATATYRNIWLKGIVRTNATGTFIPQLTYSAAPGAAPVVAANSYIKMTPIGINTVTTVGAWA
ncbi:MAG: hypothetical protein ACO3UU_00945 [Minisyncoccia bacterium]